MRELEMRCEGDGDVEVEFYGVVKIGCFLELVVFGDGAGGGDLYYVQYTSWLEVEVIESYSQITSTFWTSLQTG